ncbi:hypothetical protein C8R45DRAFT_946665 [Mycena sanguinolenta]|nr:hypothetical protein C8R45DRAFT_946665 [Mycena sanguinolenta]
MEDKIDALAPAERYRSTPTKYLASTFELRLPFGIADPRAHRISSRWHGAFSMMADAPIDHGRLILINGPPFDQPYSKRQSQRRVRRLTRLLQASYSARLAPVPRNASTALLPIRLGTIVCLASPCHRSASESGFPHHSWLFTHRRDRTSTIHPPNCDLTATRSKYQACSAREVPDEEHSKVEASELSRFIAALASFAPIRYWCSSLGIWKTKAHTCTTPGSSPPGWLRLTSFDLSVKAPRPLPSSLRAGFHWQSRLQASEKENIDGVAATLTVSSASPVCAAFPSTTPRLDNSTVYRLSASSLDPRASGIVSTRHRRQ